ncbi:MAG: hypothetical protein J5654_12380 [Victivallales bacterium]|nr:hypothetical protein [Victivallales bacterium]
MIAGTNASFSSSESVDNLPNVKFVIGKAWSKVT